MKHYRRKMELADGTRAAKRNHRLANEYSKEANANRMKQASYNRGVRNLYALYNTAI